MGVIALVAFGSVAAEEVRYIHTDVLGSVVAMTDESANVVERREYEPYGAQLTPTASDGPGYTGHVQDALTGLTYMQQRYYDPILGMFLSTDPVSVRVHGSINFNRYSYALSSPYTLIDPDGRDAVYLTDTRELVIPVYFTGSRATEAMKREIIERAGGISSNSSMIKSIRVVEAAVPGRGINNLKLTHKFDARYGPAGEGAYGSKHAQINCAVGNCAGKSVHDLLHLAGVTSEGYYATGTFEEREFAGFQSGYDNSHIMADPVNGAVLRAHEADQAIDSPDTSRMRSRGFQGVFRVDGRLDSNELAKRLGGQ